MTCVDLAEAAQHRHDDGAGEGDVAGLRFALPTEPSRASLSGRSLKKTALSAASAASRAPRPWCRRGPGCGPARASTPRARGAALLARRRTCHAPCLEAARRGSRSTGGSRTGCPCRGPLSGLMMNMCAVAGLRSASALIDALRPMLWIFSSARASQSGWPAISAPMRSASYSRERLIAICTRPAAMRRQDHDRDRADDAERVVAVVARAPKNSAKFASIEMAPAIVAVTVMVSVSRFLMCASSWASTPASSSRDRRCMQARRDGDRAVRRDRGRWRRRSAARSR